MCSVHEEDKVTAYLNSFRYDPVLVGMDLNKFKFKSIYLKISNIIKIGQSQDSVSGVIVIILS